MNDKNYSPLEILYIKGSFLYFIGLIVLCIISNVFLFVSKIPLTETIKPMSVYIVCMVLGFFIYQGRKKRKKREVLAWIVGLLTVAVPIIAKYNYGKQYGWTFAVQSYNSTALLIIFVMLLYLLYNKRVFIFYSIFAIANWSFFFYYAIKNGADVHVLATAGDVGIITGVIMLREVFFIIITAMLFYLTYRNIPVIEEFNARTARQRAVIEEQADQRLRTAMEVKERATALLTQVDEQNSLVSRFNEKMQNQSATFEEMSASMEELLSTAENISGSASDQVEGNVAMEQIITDFRHIKEETTAKLRDTYTDIEGIVAQTSISNESLREVERTITKINEQSTRIGETVSIIVDIADKINLLSLNASIEAARAGEFGRGFAVVADEIGKLAVQTSDSIKEIERVLSLSSRITEEGVGVITTTAETIKKLIANMGQSSEKIKLLQESIMVEERYIRVVIEQMEKNIDLARSIGTATEEEKKAIEDTTKAIDHANEIVGAMVIEIRELADTSRVILQNATELMKKSDEAV